MKVIYKITYPWESETSTDSEVSRKQAEYIRSYRSNDPSVGYNRWPRFTR
jgi:hypothetical protein